MIDRMRIVPSIVVLLAACSGSYGDESKNFIRNGGFESNAAGSISQWKTEGNVALQKASGQWHTFTCEFSTADYEQIAFYFGVEEGAIGSIWIDNIRSSDVTVENASFETEPFDSGQFGWNPSNYNKTIFLDSKRASDGQSSIRITHVNEAVPTSRIHRKFAAHPGQKFKLTFDVFIGDDFQGEAKGLVFNGGMSDCILTNWGGPFASRLVELRDRCGVNLLILTPAPDAPAQIVQEISIDSGQNLQAAVDINQDDFKGSVKVVVDDPATGNVVKQFAIEDPGKGWDTLRMSLQSATDKLRFRLLAQGEGTVQIDNLAITSPQTIPPIQNAKWLPASQNFQIPPTLAVIVEGAHGQAMEGALELLAKDLKKFDVSLLETDAAEAAGLIISIAPENEVKGKGQEAYALAINPDGIRIKGSTEAGAFYGVMTLLQLLDAPADGLVALACDITDYPDMPMRGVLYADPEQAARWKMNTLMYSTGMPTKSEPGRSEISDVVRICQKLNLQFIPYFITMYAGHYVEKVNPNLAAGIWTEGEKITLNGNQPAQLAHPRVIRTQLTDVSLTSSDGKTQYVIEKDYKVIDGDIAHPYDQADPKPFAISRIEGSAIPDGSTVLASYNYVDRSQTHTKIHIAYCPIEPETQKLMSAYITELAQDYPFKFLHPAHCLYEYHHPFNELSRDGRVIQSGKKPVELLVEDVRLIDQALKAGNPKARILQWAGALDDVNRAAEPLLPRDAHVQVWGYDTSWPSLYGKDAIDFWSEKGFETSVMSWVDLRNIRGWAQVVAEAQRKGYPCRGMINACWPQAPNPAAGMEESAIVSWRIPKKGESRFVELSR